MRLATRTGLAAFAGATVSLLLIGAAFSRSLSRTLEDRVDAQLEDRAETAPILAAVADRLARSELSTTVEGARVVIDGRTIELGRLPDEPLPPVSLSILGGEGFATVSAGDERWRLLTIPVSDVPTVGDATVVQLASPLGDVDARTAELRRRLGLVGLLAAAGAGLLGYVLGRRATRPLAALRADAGRFDDADPATWSVSPSYGSPDVDDVADALNAGLASLAIETERREAALEASRAFAAAATHELRTPLQSALTNVDIARSPLASAPVRDEALEAAHDQLRRMASGLTAVRALADAELADPSWFVPSDLAELVDVVVAEERRRTGATVELTVLPCPDDADADGARSSVPLWRDGVQLAVGNVVRNALLHGRRGDDPARVTVTVAGSTVIVDDDGPGVAPADRARVVRRFERGSDRPGSGLGLTIADEVARGHGGGIAIGTSPSGGARVELRFGPPPAP